MKISKNKNAFTLVEVLAVVVILAILSLLVTAGISGYFQGGKDDYDKKLSDQLAISGKTYFSSNRYLLPSVVTDRKYAYVTAAEMQSNNYIQNEFKDAEGRECSSSYVFVKETSYDSGDYEYTPCLICTDKDGNVFNHYDDETIYCDPSRWQIDPVKEMEEFDDTDTCTKLDKGYLEVNGECVCPQYKEDTGTECICPHGMEDNGENCICPNGKVESEDGCVCPSNQIEVNGECVCPTGMTWDEEKCVCPTGMEWNGTECACPNGKIKSGDKCVCPSGKVLKNGVCVVPSTPYCEKVNKGYKNGPNGECLCKSPKVEKNGSCVCPTGFTEVNGQCVCPSPKIVKNGICQCPTNKGFVEENGKCVCKKPKIVKNGICQCPDDTHWEGGTCKPKTCEKLDKGYVNGTNGKCICPKPKVEKDGKCICPTNKGYVVENGKCLCKAPRIEKNGKCVCPDGTTWNASTKTCDSDPDPDPVIGEFTCNGTFDTADRTIKLSVTSKLGISRLYYVITGKTKAHLLTVTSKQSKSGVIKDVLYSKDTEGNRIPPSFDVYVEDLQGTISGACKIKDLECPAAKQERGYANASGGECKCEPPKVQKTIDGKKWCLSPSQLDSPKCECYSIPSGYVGSKGATFKIQCKNTDVAIKTLSGWKSKITLKNDNGSLKSLDYSSSSTGKTILISGKYVPSDNIEKKDKIIVEEGIVSNQNSTKKINSRITCDWMYADTKGPKITIEKVDSKTGDYVKTSLSKSYLNSGHSNYYGYKNKVTLRAKCEDGYSGVKKFKVDNKSVSTPKSKTYDTRGSHKMSVSCTDKNGNTSTKTSSSYRVLKKESNCTKCGVSQYKSCVNSGCDCKTYNRCDSCDCESWVYKSVNHYGYKWVKSNVWYNYAGQFPSNDTLTCAAGYAGLHKYVGKWTTAGGISTVTVTQYECTAYVSYTTQEKSYCGQHYRCSRCTCYERYSCQAAVCGCKTGVSCFY